MIISNNHYMLVGWYIIVIFLSLFAKANCRGMGVGSGAKAPKILKFDIFLPNFLQKYCFLSFEWWKCNFTTSGPSCKIINGPTLENPLLAIPCKNIFGPPLENPLLAPPFKKILPAPMFSGTCSSVEMLTGYTARESLGTPAISCGIPEKRARGSQRFTFISNFKCLYKNPGKLWETARKGAQWANVITHWRGNQPDTEREGLQIMSAAQNW